MISPGSTNDEDVARHKVIALSLHGWGKTHQAINMKRRYGKGLILSGESGLLTLKGADIPYVKFTSWNGDDAPAENSYSFISLLKYLRSGEFKAEGYNWVMVDSLTELSDLLSAHLEKEMPDANGFQFWGEYSKLMLGALKVIRDLDVHVVVTSLVKESETDEGKKDYWPSIKGSAVSKQLCGIFDHVLCGVRKTSMVKVGESEEVRVTRWIVTDEVHGWHGKIRNPHGHVPPILKTGDITTVLDMIERGPEKPMTGEVEDTSPEIEL